MENWQVVLHCSLIEGLGPAALDKLLSFIPKGAPLKQIYQMSAGELVNLGGLAYEKAHLVVAGLQDRRLLDQELELLAQNDEVQLLTCIDDEYPALLRATHLYPPVLYVQGAPLPYEEQGLAIVGSRQADLYGQRIIDDFVPQLVMQGWTIVSGGALGADTMAHRATVKAGGRTRAVLGSGLLCPYPAENRQLFERIAACGGSMVSPFPLMMQGMPGNFPARNRIISGLSKGVLVVQAASRSGASITAHYAMDQGREVFAIPGPIDNPLSHGCHKLIQEGAKLVHNLKDILSELDYEAVATPRAQTAVQLSIETAADDLPEVAITSEKMIVQACHKGASVDELMAKTGLSLQELNGKLFNLQLLGYIKQSFAGTWEAN